MNNNVMYFLEQHIVSFIKNYIYIKIEKKKKKKKKKKNKKKYKKLI